MKVAYIFIMDTIVVFCRPYRNVNAKVITQAKESFKVLTEKVASVHCGFGPNIRCC